MKRTLALLIPLLLLTHLNAAEPPPSEAPPELPEGERYLFVIGTSTSMERLDYSGRQALFNLIYTGIDGHMRPGDTFGVWTFNNKLNAGNFPMQVWNTNDLLKLASKVSQYVENQNYGGKLRTDRALGASLNVIKLVNDVNILFISDEHTRLKGTPFDDIINKVYKDRADELEKSFNPFITTFIGRGGKLFNVSVFLAGEKIILPDRVTPEPEPIVAAITTPPVQKKAPSSSSKSTQPRTIIIKRETLSDGSKSEVKVSVDGKPTAAATKKDDIGHIEWNPVIASATPLPQPVPPATTEALEPGQPAPPVTAEVAAPTPKLSVASTPVVPIAEAPSRSTTEPGIGSTLARLQPTSIAVSARQPAPVPPTSPIPAVAAFATPTSASSRDGFLWVVGGVTFVVVSISMAIVFGILLRREQQHSAITQSMYRK